VLSRDARRRFEYSVRGFGWEPLRAPAISIVRASMAICMRTGNVFFPRYPSLENTWAREELTSPGVIRE
jgi:hypothetical protein